MTTRKTIAAILSTTAVAFAIAPPSEAAKLARQVTEGMYAENREYTPDDDRQRLTPPRRDTQR